MITTWTVLPNAKAVADQACDRIVLAAQNALKQRGEFRIVLAGGETPQGVYQQLSQTVQEWSRWHIYLSDERCLPAHHPQRNSTMIHRSLLDHVPIPVVQIHEIRAELGAERAAYLYSKELEFPFDMILLGLGEDGHTASLFPEHKYFGGGWVVAVHDAPKRPSERVSLSALALGMSERLLFLVTGSHKRQAIARWQRGEALPANSIVGNGQREILLDLAAWGRGVGG